MPLEASRTILIFTETKPEKTGDLGRKWSPIKLPPYLLQNFKIQDMRINKMAPLEKALFAVKSHNLNSTFRTWWKGSPETCPLITHVLRYAQNHTFTLNTCFNISRLRTNPAFLEEARVLQILDQLR